MTDASGAALRCFSHTVQGSGTQRHAWGGGLLRPTQTLRMASGGRFRPEPKCLRENTRKYTHTSTRTNTLLSMIHCCDIRPHTREACAMLVMSRPSQGQAMMLGQREEEQAAEVQVANTRSMTMRSCFRNAWHRQEDIQSERERGIVRKETTHKM